jgi:hypothetical protein
VDALVSIKRELGPLLDALLEQLVIDQNRDAERFFARIATSIAHAAEADDLAGPFMELTLSAPVAHQTACSLEAVAILDELLGSAQSIALTLSAPSQVAN